MTHYFQKAFAGLFFFLCFYNANSKILKVETVANSGAGSLRDQIAAASPNDTILINIKGTLIINGPHLIFDKPLTILGPSASHFTIDVNSWQVIFDIPAGNIVVDGIRFTSPSFLCGDYISVQQGTNLTIRDCVFEGTQISGDGGALKMMHTSVLNIENSSFFNCLATLNGGAIYVGSTNQANIRNCTFFGNSAQFGGAVYNDGNVLLVNNTFLNNTSTAGTPNGHAVMDGNNAAGSTTRIQNNIFTDVSAPKYPDLLAGNAANMWITNGGNVFSNSTESFLPGGPNDRLNEAIGNLFLRVNPITDGYGLKYFTITSQTSTVIDNGITNANVNPTDCRRAPRILFGDTGVDPDAGAVEFTPYTMTANSSAGLVTSWNAMNSSGFSGPKYMDFDISGGGPVNYAPTAVLNNSTSTATDWIVDGFTQDGSKVPGPGNTPNSYTPAVYMIHIQNSTSGIISLVNPGLNSFISGLSLSNPNTVAIHVDGGQIHIYGNKIIASGPLGSDAIYLENNNNALIGGEFHHCRNVLGNQTNAGINAFNNVTDISGNFIGCDATGTTDQSSDKGVFARGAICNVIGKIGLPSMNIISGNNTAQVDIQSGMFLIRGNIIGPDFTMNAMMGPCQFGIHAESNTEGDIGGVSPGSMNVIGGNSTGILLQGCNAAGVFGNFIGISPDGTSGFPSIPNSTGISIVGNGDANHFIGNGTVKARNYICNSTSIGIYVEDAANHTIMGNFIGVKPDNSAAGNGSRGIHLVGSATEGNDILGNIIGDHSSAGIDVNGANGSGNISGNKIGTDSTGMVAIPNGRGIQVAATGPNSQIIGNLISGNLNEGIHLDNSIHTIEGNLIGPNMDTTLAIGNGGDGITLLNTNSCNIFNNYIGGSGANGILLMAGSSNWIHGNHIGTNRIGMDFGNQQDGITLFFVSANNMIGGVAAADQNDIMFNLGAGISVERENSVTGIRGNRFFQNGGHGISLNPAVGVGVVLANDVNDADVSGPAGPNVGNNGQNTPDVNGAVLSAGTCTFSGTMNVDNVSANYLIQVYKVNPGNIDATGHGEGDTLLAEQTFNAGGLNTFNFSMSITGPVLGDVLSATASKIVSTNYETSEFSDTIVVRAPYTVSIIDSTDVLCNGAADGRLEVSVNGGTNPPFTYQWYVGSSPIGGANASVYFGGPGTYFCVVTDAASVSVNSDTATIIEPPLLTATPTVSNVSCNGFCDGSIVISETGGVPPYQYSIDGGLGYQPTTTFINLCASATPFDYLVQDGNGCLSALGSVTVTEPSPISTSESVTDETCQGLNDGTVTITALGGTAPHTFQIDGAGGFSTTSFYNNLASGTHTLDVIDANGCIFNSNFFINPGTNVTANFNFTSPNFCEDLFNVDFTDASTTSSSISAYNWTFSGASPSAATIANVSGVMFFNGGINNVTLDVITVDGCTSTITLPVTIHSKPIVNAGGDVNICLGTPFTHSPTVSGNGPMNFSWAPGGHFANPIILNAVVVSGIYGVAGTYSHSLNVVDANGCTWGDTMILTVNPLPTVNAGLDNTVCSGNPYTLSGSGSATIYTWDNSVIDGTSFNPVSTLTYTVTGTDGNSCQATDQVTITVLNVTSNAGPDVTICNGQSQVLDGSSSTGAVSFQWDEVGGTNVSNTTTAAVAPTVTTSYALTVVGGSCVDYDTVLVTVIGAPDASFTYPQSAYCQNAANPSPTAVTPGGTYSMPAAPGNINTTSGIVSMATLGTGTYNVIYTLTTPCFAADTFQIIINSLPNVTMNGPVTICSNTPAFDLNLFNPPTTGGTWSGTGVTDPNFDPSVAGVGTFGPIYTLTDANGCTNTDSVTIHILAPPTATVSGVNSNYCITDSPFTPTGNPAGGLWSVDGTAFTTLTTVDPSVLGNGFHTLSYQYTDAITGCIGTSFPSGFTISNVPLDPIAVSNTSQSICAGTSLLLSVTNPNTGGTSVQWYSDPGLTVNVGSSINFNTPVLTNSITYYAVTQNAGCKSNAIVFTITVNNAQVVAGPDLTICPGTTAQLNVTSSAGTISWSPSVSLNDSTIANPVATPNVNTTYYVTVVSGPCYSIDSVTVFIDGSNPDCGIVPSYNAFSPDIDGVNDTWIVDAIFNHPDNTVTIFNRWGDKLVSFDDYDNVNVVWDGTYKGNILPSGTYFYVIEYHDIQQQVSGWLQLTR